jgi:hypothetical protein
MKINFASLFGRDVMESMSCRDPPLKEMMVANLTCCRAAKLSKAP